MPITMIPLIAACLTAALVTLALVRERHLRLALQALLARLLQHWRCNAKNTPSSADRDHAAHRRLQ